MSTKRKGPTKLAAPVVRHSAKLPAKTRIDESKTLVSAGRGVSSKGIATEDAVEISSDSSEQDESSEEDDDEEDEEEDDEGGNGEVAKSQESTSGSQNAVRERPPTTNTKPNRAAEGTAKRPAADDPSASDSEPQSPTFGELARTRNVDVQAQLAQQAQPLGAPSPLSLATPNGGALAPPALSSLGTVLTQALRSDDTELLESCLQTRDQGVIRATIQRLDSSLAGALLSRLAARMHRRPGRASSLIIWVQWTLIAHGGALAAQPDLHRKLADLNRVLEERSRGLNSLLALKGKLDLLEAQMQLRRGPKGAGAAGPGGARNGVAGFGDDDDDEDARGVVYVEGDDAKTVNGTVATGDVGDDDDQFDISAVNGVDSDSDSEDDDDDSDEDGDEYRRAAAGEEPIDDDEVDFDDVDESGEDDSDVEAAAPPSKVQKTSSAFQKKR